MKHKRLQKESHYVLRSYEGEELLSKVREFCAREGVHSGSFFAIGALQKAILGFFDTHKKEYVRLDVGEAEIASCMGNICMREGEIMTHVHAVLSKREGGCLGGHLFEAYVSATAEIFLDSYAERLERRKDEDTTLFLMDLG